MDKGKIHNHITNLQERHDKLEQEISQLSHSFNVDEQVSALKREKLRIKDEIALYTARLV